MKTDNGKILEATTKELYHLWLNDGWSEQVSFPDFVCHVKGTGATVTEVQGYAINR